MPGELTIATRELGVHTHCPLEIIRGRYDSKSDLSSRGGRRLLFFLKHSQPKRIVRPKRPITVSEVTVI